MPFAKLKFWPKCYNYYAMRTFPKLLSETKIFRSGIPGNCGGDCCGITSHQHLTQICRIIIIPWSQKRYIYHVQIRKLEVVNSVFRQKGALWHICILIVSTSVAYASGLYPEAGEFRNLVPNFPSTHIFLNSRGPSGLPTKVL